MTMRMGEALDRSLAPGGDEHEKLLLRLGLPTGKYWICKRTPFHAYEAMECLGGNGVTEDFILARLYRDAPINAIWEGSAMCRRWTCCAPWPQPRSACCLACRAGQNPRRQHGTRQRGARSAAGAGRSGRGGIPGASRGRPAGLTMQASLLLQAGNHAVADAFIASRLGQSGERNYGTRRAVSIWMRSCSGRTRAAEPVPAGFSYSDGSTHRSRAMNPTANKIIMNMDAAEGMLPGRPQYRRRRAPVAQERLAAALRLFGRFGFDEGVAGHITVRDPEHLDHFWLTRWAFIKADAVSDLLRVNHKGEVVEGKGLLNGAAFTIHSQIHMAHPEVTAAAHAHSVYGKSWSSLGACWTPLPRMPAPLQ